MIRNLKGQNHHIIIGGDFNEQDRTANIIQDIIEKHQLVDVMLLSDLTNKSTYVRGPHTLDRIFVRPPLISPSTRASIEALNSITISDHFPMKLHIKTTTEIIPEYQTRKLTSNHTHKVTKYIKSIHKHMQKLNLFKVIENLDPRSVTTHHLSHIDNQLTSIRLKTERKLKKQQVNWWHKDLITWKAELKRHNVELKKMKQERPKPQQEILQTLILKQQVVAKFRMHTQHSFQIRHQILKEEISVLKQQNPKNIKKINHLRHLIRTEKIREIYRKIKGKISTKNNNNMYLQVETGNGEISTINETEDIAQHISHYNKAHFSQAQNTPLSTYVYTSTKNPQETSQQTNKDWSLQQVRQNEHLSEQSTMQLQPLMNKFLQQIAIPPRQTISDTIEIDQWKRKIKK